MGAGRPCPIVVTVAQTADTVDVVFSFHGYPGAIHQLVHGRPDADRFRVRGGRRAITW